MLELVTGGSGSGKSAYAEEHICRIHRILSRKAGRKLPLFYIAAMIPRGEETLRKIERHRKMRETRGFQTLEWYTDIAGKIREKSLPENACVLLECLSNLTANEIYEPEGAGENAADAVTEGVRMLQNSCSAVVVVTNEVFSEVPSESGGETDEMTEYKRILGEINRTLAETADQVTEVVYGIPCGVRGGRELKLVTGGAFQGKYAWASSEYPGLSWTDGGICSLDEIHTFQGMNRFHLFIRRWLEAGREKEELTDLILERQGEIVLVWDEIGCGLVPIDASDREYREAVGRICTELAAEAVRADRVVCGIARRLK